MGRADKERSRPTYKNGRVPQIRKSKKFMSKGYIATKMPSKQAMPCLSRDNIHYLCMRLDQIFIHLSIPNSTLRSSGITFCLHKHALLLQQLSQTPILMHTQQDITSPNKLFVHIKLRNRRPLRVFLNSYNANPVSDSVSSLSPNLSKYLVSTHHPPIH